MYAIRCVPVMFLVVGLAASQAAAQRPAELLPDDKIWTLRLDDQLDNVLPRALSSIPWRIRVKGNVISGSPAEGDPKRATIVGEVIPGQRTLVTWRQSNTNNAGNSVIYVGHLSGNDMVIGTWFDSTGRAGDFEFILKEEPGAGPDGASGPGLVVVVPAALERSLSDYVAHKKKQLPVEVVTLEAIRRDHPDADDDAHRVKLELFRQWKTKKIGYVLLVGGADIMPVRYRALVNSDFGTPGNLVYSMSDHYYADIAKKNGEFEDWNGRKDGESRWLYGESRITGPKPAINADGIDFFPELAVGRWPVSNAAGAKLMAEKTVRYETGLRTRRQTDQTDAAFLLWDDLAPRQFVNNWRGMLVGWRTEYQDALGPLAQRATTESATNVFNGGTRLVFDFGHGSPNGWGGFGRQHLPQLKNADKLPIVVSIGCDTAPLGPGILSDGYRSRNGVMFNAKAPAAKGQVPPPPDVYQPELRRTVRPSFGHEMIAGRPTGAVAYIGFILNSNQWYQLHDGFFTAVMTGGTRHKRLGECWRQALTHQRKAREGDIARNEGNFDGFYAADQGLRTILLGDPTLLLSDP